MKLYGNRGICNPAPGTVRRAWCEVCGTEMNVERNTLGATSMAESQAGRKHLYDRFRCPHLAQNWHRSVVALLYRAIDLGICPERRRLLQKARNIIERHR